MGLPSGPKGRSGLSPPPPAGGAGLGAAAAASAISAKGQNDAGDTRSMVRYNLFSMVLINDDGDLAKLTSMVSISISSIMLMVKYLF